MCLSTEEVLAEFKRLNDRGISDDVVVGSADVKALYPSLDIPFAVDKACEIFYDSAVRIVGIDTEELGLYLTLNRTKEQLEELGLLLYCPTRKKRRGRPPTITGRALDECRSKRFGPWQIPNNEPSERMTRKMLTEAMRVVLLFIMQNHIYIFDDEIKLQSRGGPIGLQLTGVLAQLFMVWWDRQLERRMGELGLEKRHVDDVNVIVTETTPGLRFNGIRIVSSEDTIEEDRRVETDERAMRLLQAIANSIHSLVEMEIDCLSRHRDEKLPILDLKVWIEKIGQDQQRNRPGSVILHEFYSKEVASKSVVNARSALSWSCKNQDL